MAWVFVPISVEKDLILGRGLRHVNFLLDTLLKNRFVEKDLILGRGLRLEKPPPARVFCPCQCGKGSNPRKGIATVS